MAGKAFAGLATAFVAGTMAISGCGGSEPTTYNDEVEHNFVSSCVDSATAGSTPAAESDAERICGCMYDELKARMSFEEFKAADESLRQGEKMSADLASTLQAAATACA
jgi:hypothetical protein